MVVSYGDIQIVQGCMLISHWGTSFICVPLLSVVLKLSLDLLKYVGLRGSTLQQIALIGSWRHCKWCVGLHNYKSYNELAMVFVDIFLKEVFRLFFICYSMKCYLPVYLWTELNTGFAATNAILIIYGALNFVQCQPVDLASGISGRIQRSSSAVDNDMPSEKVNDVHWFKRPAVSQVYVPLVNSEETTPHPIVLRVRPTLLPRTTTTSTPAVAVNVATPAPVPTPAPPTQSTYSPVNVVAPNVVNPHFNGGSMLLPSPALPMPPIGPPAPPLLPLPSRPLFTGPAPGSVPLPFLGPGIGAFPEGYHPMSHPGFSPDYDSSIHFYDCQYC